MNIYKKALLISMINRALNFMNSNMADIIF